MNLFYSCGLFYSTVCLQLMQPSVILFDLFDLMTLLMTPHKKKIPLKSKALRPVKH